MQLWRVAVGVTAAWVLVCLFSVASVYAQYKVITVSEGGTIAGNVRFVGKPRIENLEVGKDTRHCGSAKASPRLSLDKSGGVKNAVVMLVGIKKGKAIEKPAKVVIDQKACEYTPHVQAVPIGTQLEVVNSDPILHNVHAYNPEGRTLFNIAQPIKGQRTSSKRMQFKEPGVYSLACDAGHIWMSAFVVAVEHPYFAITDEEGTFKIENVPPGTYKIKMWHEGSKITKKDLKDGKVVRYHFEEPYEEMKEVTVGSKGLVTVDFDLKPREE